MCEDILTVQAVRIDSHFYVIFDQFMCILTKCNVQTCIFSCAQQVSCATESLFVCFKVTVVKAFDCEQVPGLNPT